jgi:predicted GTPase
VVEDTGGEREGVGNQLVFNLEEGIFLNLKILYNPYRVKTDFYRDESIIEFPEAFSKKRIQDWQYSDFLESLNNKSNTNGITITFVGRKIDFEDFKYSVENTNDYESSGIKIEHQENFENKIVIKKLNRYFELLLNKYSEELKDTKIKDIIEKTTNKEFPISVMATMSSGKSTLINAMLENDLLPAQNQACTAKITSIKDIDGLNDYSAKAYDKDGLEVSWFDKLTPEDLKKTNDNDKIERIEIIGDIPNISSEYMNLVLYDTPGPNNARNKTHREHTRKMLHSDEKPMILYVMNATQLAITDDRDLLLEISSEIKKTGNLSKDRFLFVINKVDNLDPDQDGTIEELIEEAKKYLKKFDIKNPQIFPVSSEYAKLIRLHNKNCKLTNKKRKLLKNHTIFLEYMKLDEYAPFTYSTKKELFNKLKTIQGNTYLEALYHTGIPTLEMYINEYLHKYALPIKVYQAVQDIKTILKKMGLDTEEFIYFCNEEELVEGIQILNSEEMTLNFKEVKEIVEEVDFKIQELFAEIENDSENTNMKFENSTKMILQNTVLLKDTLNKLSSIEKTAPSNEYDNEIMNQLTVLKEKIETGIPEILNNKFEYEKNLLNEIKQKFDLTEEKLLNINTNYSNLIHLNDEKFSELTVENGVHAEALKNIEEIINTISEVQKKNNIYEFKEEIKNKFNLLKSQLDENSVIYKKEFVKIASFLKEHKKTLIENQDLLHSNTTNLKNLSLDNMRMINLLEDDSNHHTLLEKFELLNSLLNKNKDEMEALNTLNTEYFKDNKQHKMDLLQYFKLHETRINEIEEKYDASLANIDKLEKEIIKENGVIGKHINSLSEMFFNHSGKTEDMESSMTKLSKMFFYLFGFMAVNFIGIVILIIILFLK